MLTRHCKDSENEFLLQQAQTFLHDEMPDSQKPQTSVTVKQLTDKAAVL